MYRTPWRRVPMLLAVVVSATAHAQPYAYVASGITTHGDLAIVDLATDAVSTVPIAAGSLAVVAGATRVYVSSYTTGEVVVVDAASRAVVTRIQVGGFLGQLALSRDESRLYAVVLWPSKAVAAIDTATNAVLRTAPVPNAEAIAVSVDGQTVYVGGAGAAEVYELDPSTLAVARTIALPTRGPHWLVALPDGSRVYASEKLGDGIAVISVPQHQFVRSIRLPGHQVGAIAIHPTAPRAYVADRFSRISVVDTTTDSVLKTVGGIGSDPFAVAVTDDGSRVYVVDPCVGGSCTDGQIHVFDTSVEQVTKTIAPVARHPSFMGHFLGGGGRREVEGLRCPADLCRLFPRPNLHFCDAHPHECVVRFPPLPWCRGLGCGIAELERFDPSREGVFVGRVEGARVVRAEGVEITREPRAPFERLEPGSVLHEGSVLRIPPAGQLELETPAGAVRTPERGLPPRGEGGSWLFYVVGRGDEKRSAE